MVRRSVPMSVVLTTVFAALIVVAVLVTVVVRRPDPGPSAYAGGDATTRPPDTGCGGGSCRVLAHTDLGGTPVDLLTDSAGGLGRLRAGGVGSQTIAETVITTMGARLNSESLRCVDATRDACLVRGPSDGGMVGEVHLWVSGSWRNAGQPYFSDAGSIVLENVTGDDIPEVVVVRHDCARGDSVTACQRAPVLTEVFGLGGAQVGCTTTYASPGDLRNWPEVLVSSAEVGDCP